MKNPIIYVGNLIRVLYLKIRYATSLKIGFIQSFEKLRLVITKGSKVKIGEFNQNRGNLFIGIYGGNLIIGNRCFFNINCSITCMDNIEMGDNCKFGNNLVIVDHDHNFRAISPEFITSSIKIGNNVWIGANVTILRGTTIGDNCVIGAGSVVKQNIPSNLLYIKGKLRGK